MSETDPQATPEPTHRCRCGATISDPWALGSPLHMGCPEEGGGNFLPLQDDLPGQRGADILQTLRYLGRTYTSEGMHSWLASEQPQLDGAKPIQMLLAGDSKSVVSAAYSASRGAA